MNPDHEQLENALAAYLLGATADEEAAEVREHLRGCASCQALARRLRRATEELPLGVEAASASPELRGRILTAASPSPARDQAFRRQTWTPPQRRRAIRTWPRPPARALPVAAAAILVFALGAGIGLGLGRTTVPQPAPSVAQYSLKGVGPMAGATGRVYELKSEGLTFVQFTGLPQPDQGHVYELWLIPKQGQPVPAGVFAPSPQGDHLVVLDRSLGGVAQLAVTQEPAPNGSGAPTQQPQLAGAIG